MRKPRKEILNLYNAEYNIVLTYLGNKISITSKNAQVASPSESNYKLMKCVHNRVARPFTSFYCRMASDSRIVEWNNGVEWWNRRIVEWQTRQLRCNFRATIVCALNLHPG